ncbi:ROK family protein [Xinfangfangia sp. CPCC 101601]|uniref:N-acetylglucosamine kinase n=1 Tax=Pseudogemmobacter lacusdianii TaxID=3069608 RepID=A0ABU0VXP7_9RHOB|nr:ROK family protein [Xinfangfangia sp. CPCC 101601]MDQ2066534.1 ROK family protein [Xinfangfangia sp. CPCC 101601]
MILAFDIGGSRIRAALWDGERLQPLGEVPTPSQDIDAFTGAITRFTTGSAARGLAISIAGVVDPDTNIGTVANIAAIDGLALGPTLRAATGLPVLVLNDADCFALAEAWRGAGRGHDNVFGVILGTGVGGGLVIGGRLVHGAGGYAGEWGHGPVIHGEYAMRCGCGQKGCIDMIGGARGLERLHQLRSGEDLGSEEIITRWNAGEAAATATLELWRELVAGALSMVLNVVGASVVPVGGGLSQAPGLVAFLDEALRNRLLRKSADPLAVPAHFGADAGLLGAALAGAAQWR